MFPVPTIKCKVNANLHFANLQFSFFLFRDLILISLKKDLNKVKFRFFNNFNEIKRGDKISKAFNYILFFHRFLKYVKKGGLRGYFKPSV